MVADVVLKTLSIEDYIQKGIDPELTKFATSIENSNASNTKDLCRVNYKRATFDKTDAYGNQVNNQFIEITLSTLKFVISPKSFLTILDFVITTFTDPSQENDSSSTRASSETAVAESTPDGVASKIDLKLQLNSIILLLNDDGIKLATTKLESASVNMLMVSDTMDIEARIGRFMLHDEVNSGTDRDSMLRKLISNEGENLANFKYKTFQPGTMEYNSSIFSMLILLFSTSWKNRFQELWPLDPSLLK